MSTEEIKNNSASKTAEVSATEKKAQNKAYDILRGYNVTEDELDALKTLFRLYNIQYVNDIILSSLELIYTALEIAIAIKKES